jgi:hypothetical protein
MDLDALAVQQGEIPPRFDKATGGTIGTTSVAPGLLARPRQLGQFNVYNHGLFTCLMPLSTRTG